MRKLLFVLAVLLIGLIGRADALDLWADFPDHQGDNNLYALGFNWKDAVVDKTLAYHWLDELDGLGGYGFYAFGTLAETDYLIPLVMKGTNEVVLHPAVPDHAVEGDSNLYDGSGSDDSIENAVLRYNVPATGVYDIEGAFNKGDYGDKYVYIKINADIVFQGPLNSTTASQPFSLLNRSLAAGDYVFFHVSPGMTSGVFSDRGDTTYLTGSIDMVPEPISSALFLLGAGAFGLRLRRGKA